MGRQRAGAGGALLVVVCACGVAFDVAEQGAGGAPDTSSAAGAVGGASTSAGASPSTTTAGGGGAAQTTSGSGGRGGQGGSGGVVDLTCPSPSTVCCGSEPCPLPSMECCATNQTQTQQSVCVPAGTCPSAELPIRCDDSEDCGGDICCATWDGSNHLVIECRATCAPPSSLGNAGTYPMCSFPSGNCPSGLSCFDDCCVGDLGIGYCY
jgi:hypothetical protein